MVREHDAGVSAGTLRGVCKHVRTCPHLSRPASSSLPARARESAERLRCKRPANDFAVIAVSLIAGQLDTLAAEIAQAGGTCVTLALDVTAADTPRRIAQTARERFGRLDVLINNAGAATAGKLLEQSDAQIDAQWQLHVAAPLRITRAAISLLEQSRGQVMFVGSGLARVPSPLYGTYCAAKAAVRTMTTQLRRELHGTGVAVTYIDPGCVRTDFIKTAGIPSFDPEWIPVDADHVAKRVLRAARTRPRVVNAVPLHTLGMVLGEAFPASRRPRFGQTRDVPAAGTSAKRGNTAARRAA